MGRQKKQLRMLVRRVLVQSMSDAKGELETLSKGNEGWAEKAVGEVKKKERIFRAEVADGIELG